MDLVAHAIIFEYEVKLHGQYTSNSVEAIAEWGVEKIELKANLLVILNDVDILLELKTSHRAFDYTGAHA